jgi:hypothetical protein
MEEKFCFLRPKNSFLTYYLVKCCLIDANRQRGFTISEICYHYKISLLKLIGYSEVEVGVHIIL